MKIPKSHPRYISLLYREKLVNGVKRNIAVYQGLIAYGRGECFDYLIGEKTIPPALKAMKAAVSALLLAEKPVLSVNGNVASLVPRETVILAEKVNAKLEVNTFYDGEGRRSAIRDVLIEYGATEVLGVGDRYKLIPGLKGDRGRVSRDGIFDADVVLVPLEDGDRTEALKKMGKKVIAIDLNPLSRTSRYADITIVDNIIRAFPKMIKYADEISMYNVDRIRKILSEYDNNEILSKTIEYIVKRLSDLAESKLEKID